MLRCYLREIMFENNINMAGIVEQTGLSRNTIRKLYRSVDLETVKLDTLVKLCDTLHCSLSELIEYSTDL